MVANLIRDLLKLSQVGEIILTVNIPESLELPDNPRLHVLMNKEPKGFSENHNAAFKISANAHFCVLNPDVILLGDPFSKLIELMGEWGGDVSAPVAQAPDHSVEDSVRYFPSFYSLALKALGGSDGRYDFNLGDGPFFAEWVSGLFMLFRRDAFERIGGFDQGYFLYYEDVDICARAWKSGMKVLACPAVSVIHDARRDSHRSLRHLRWHLASMARYFMKHWGRLPRVARYEVGSR